MQIANVEWRNLFASHSNENYYNDNKKRKKADKNEILDSFSQRAHKLCLQLWTIQVRNCMHMLSSMPDGGYWHYSKNKPDSKSK